MATHELRSLVAQGEIRAFRDEDILKFRRTDVLDLKKNREVTPGELTIEPEDIGDEAPTMAEEPEAEAPEQPAKGPKHETEETELLTGIGEGKTTDFLGLDDTAEGPEDTAGDTAQTVVPTIEVADDDIIDDTAQTVIPTVSTDDETNVLGEEDTGEPEAPSLLAEEDEATEMATQEIEGEEIEAPTAPAAAPEEEAAPAEEPLRFQDAEATAPASDELGITTDDVAAGATSGVTAPRRSQRYKAQTAAPAVSPLFLVVAILTFVVLLFSVPLFYGLIRDEAPTFAPYEGLIEHLSKDIGRR
jgi:hypothetical protein